jgi:High potential iron-sulfur protein
MTDSKLHTLDISRRGFIRGVGLVAGVGALVGGGLSATSAVAGSKFSQAMAKYQPTPRGADRCANCSLYESAGTCRVVEGKVEPNGWCSLYVRKAG